MDEVTFSTHLCSNQQEMEATQADVGVLINGLGRNIIEHLAIAELGRAIRIFIRDSEGRTVGGISADAFGSWAFISLLWVEESWRNQGYGSELLRRLEAEALRLRCRSALVDTYSFEARPFYERWGYEVFATLEDCPDEGHCKYFLRKRLAE
jgi:GNAT superfamily N-acetyltransferase